MSQPYTSCVPTYLTLKFNLIFFKFMDAYPSCMVSVSDPDIWAFPKYPWFLDLDFEDHALVTLFLTLIIMIFSPPVYMFIGEFTWNRTTNFNVVALFLDVIYFFQMWFKSWLIEQRNSSGLNLRLFSFFLLM